MSKHTPGPWRVSQLDDSCVLAGPAGTIVAYAMTVGMRDVVAPNVRLIAAAPEMLGTLLDHAAFLDGLANRLDDWARQSEGGGWSTHQVGVNRDAANDCRRRAAELRAAIAKAEGR